MASVRDVGVMTRRAEGARGATRVVDGLIKEGFTYVVDADLQAYFDTIPHDRLMQRVEEKISDGRILDLIRGWLKADILKGTEQWTPTGGTPSCRRRAPPARRRVEDARLRHDVL